MHPGTKGQTNVPFPIDITFLTQRTQMGQSQDNKAETVRSGIIYVNKHVFWKLHSNPRRFANTDIITPAWTAHRLKDDTRCHINTEIKSSIKCKHLAK